MAPILIAALLRARPIEPRQIRPRRRLDARGLRQPRQKLLIRFPRVAPHDAPQGRVGLERRGIDPDRLALDEVSGCQDLQDPREHRAMGLQVDQTARPRNRRVLGRGLRKAQPQKPAQRERIGRPPRNAPLGVDALEVPDQQQSEVRARRQTRASDRVGVERRALRLHERVEGVRVEHLIQPLIERMAAGLGQLVGGDPQSGCPRSRFPPSHGHAEV